MANQTADKLQEVATGIQIQNFVNKIDEEEAKRSKAEIKETKELVSALRDLQKKIGEINADNKDKSPAHKTLSAWFEDKVAPIKKLTSLQGITETLAAKAGPGLVGTLLGGVAEGMQVATEEKQRQKSFVTSILEGTEEGRTWQEKHGVEKATQMALEHYKEREELEKQLAAFDLQEKMIQGEHGVEGAGLDAETEARREEVRKKLKANKERFVANKSVESEKTVQQETQSSESIRKELMTGVREGLQQEYESLSPEDKAALDKNPEERDIMIEAAMQEIAKLSEEQLAELVRIANALDVNDLEEKENRLEEDKQQIDLKKEEKEEKNPTKSLLEKGLGLFQKEFKGLSSIFSKGLSFLSSGLTKLIGPLASMIPSLLSSLGPAAAVAAAGAAGYAFGTHVVNPILNNAAESITGVEGETVGTGIYTAVDNIAGSKIGNMLGFKSDSQKLKEAETQAMVDLGKKKLANGEKVSAEMAKTLKENGIEVMDDQIKQKPAKQETRTEITEAVERTADSLDVKNKEKPASIVNAPTVVNNSSNTTNITHKPIRNEEPSYISGMNRKLVF